MARKSLLLKNRLRANELTFGAWLSFADQGVAEIMAGIGFDWVLIDTEHAPFSLESLATTLLAFDPWPTVPIVRVPWNDRVVIKQVLDLGAGGILIPHVGTVEEAKLAVAACKYPPEGMRGFGPRRATNYYCDVEEYIRTANEAVIVSIQIEHINAVKAAGEIAAVPGIDVLLLGPMDLSASLGLLGQLDHAAVVGAIKEVIAAGRRAHIPVGIPIDAPPHVVAKFVDLGCQFVIVGEDHSFLKRTASDTLAQFRHQMLGT